MSQGAKFLMVRIYPRSAFLVLIVFTASSSCRSVVELELAKELRATEIAGECRTLLKEGQRENACKLYQQALVLDGADPYLREEIVFACGPTYHTWAEELLARGMSVIACSRFDSTAALGYAVSREAYRKHCLICSPSLETGIEECRDRYRLEDLLDELKVIFSIE